MIASSIRPILSLRFAIIAIAPTPTKANTSSLKMLCDPETGCVVPCCVCGVPLVTPGVAADDGVFCVAVGVCASVLAGDEVAAPLFTGVTLGVPLAIGIVAIAANRFYPLAR